MKHMHNEPFSAYKYYSIADYRYKDALSPYFYNNEGIIMEVILGV